jgi:hypothetical protein
MINNKSDKVGKFAGIPYDWRKPNKPRFLSRVWNPNAPFVNPRWWGWGYDFNAYAIIHPRKWRAARKASGKN